MKSVPLLVPYAIISLATCTLLGTPRNGSVYSYHTDTVDAGAAVEASVVYVFNFNHGQALLARRKSKLRPDYANFLLTSNCLSPIGIVQRCVNSVQANQTAGYKLRWVRELSPAAVVRDPISPRIHFGSVESLISLRDHLVQHR